MQLSGKSQKMALYWCSYCMLVITATFCVFCCDGNLASTDYLYYRLQEEKPPGSYIGNILTDSSLSNNYTRDVLIILEFMFITNGKIKELFNLDRRTGILKSKVEIDREELCPLQEDCELKLDIAVQPSSFFRVIKVHITLLDINDYSPTFEKAELKRLVLENTSPGVLFPIIPATDLDSPHYSIQSYELTGDSSHKFGLQIFRINKNDFDLRLVLQGTLDREETNHYTLEVKAYDGGTPPRIGTQLLQIHIKDVNDNAPEFKQNARELKVAENTPVGSTLVVMAAHDEDSGINGRVTYSLEDSSHRKYGDLFGVSPNNGTVKLLNSLDYEQQKLYSLKVLARDMGEVSMTSSAVVTVHVEDVNDNYPEVLVNSVSRTESGAVFVDVTEHLPSNTYVALITVKDSDENENGHTECQMQHQALESHFNFDQLMENEYKLTTKEQLDREVKPRHAVNIVCSDHGVPKLTSIITVTVSVNDVNDNPPTFTKHEYIYAVIENNVVGQTIGHIEAHDPDDRENGTISYGFCDGPESLWNGVFGLDTMTGAIVAKQKFDREKRDAFQFCAHAMDHGHEPKSTETTVTVHIEDQDDETPHFAQTTFHFFVTENQNKGARVGQLLAYDRDAPPNDELSFYLSDSRKNENFSVHFKTGVIFTKKRLDREMRDTYKLNVSVVSPRYQLHSDRAEVIITVTDVNDNLPIIQFPPPKSNTTFRISNKVPVGYEVTRIKAMDVDLGENGVVTYSLAARLSYFKVDSKTGVVSVTRDVSQFRMRSFNVPVIVSDGGRHKLNSSVGFNIAINSSMPYQLQVTNIQDTRQGFWRQNLKILFIAIAICVIVVFFIIMFSVLCVTYSKSRKKDKQQWERDEDKAENKRILTKKVEFENNTLPAESMTSSMVRSHNPNTVITY